MRYLQLFLLFNLLIVKGVQAQTPSSVELEGIYYGTIAKGYSQLKEPIIFRFYQSGLVLVQVLSSQPNDLEALEKAFSKKNKQKFGYSTYQYDRGSVEFYGSVKGYKSLFEGTVRKMDDDVVIQFTAKDSKGVTHNIIVSKVWPEKPVYTPEPVTESIPEVVKAPEVKVESTEQVKEIETTEELTAKLEVEVDESMENSELKNAVHDINALGVLEFQKGNYEASLDYFNDALNYCTIGHDSIGMVAVCQNMAASYEQTAQTNKALECFHRARVISHNIGDKESEGNILYSLSQLYKTNSKPNAEKATLLELIALELDQNNQVELAASYNNLAINLTSQFKLDSSEQYIMKGIAIAEKQNQQKTLGNLYNNLGNINFQKDNFESSVENYQKAVSIQSAAGNNREKSLTFYNLANAFVKTNNLDSARVYYDMSVELAKEANYHEVLYSDYLGLSRLYASEECKPPMDYYKMYTALRFSIDETDELKQMAAYTEKYVAKVQNENESLMYEVAELNKASDRKMVVINTLKENIRKQEVLTKLVLSEQENKNIILEQDLEIVTHEKAVADEESAKKSILLVGVALVGLLAIALMFMAFRNSKKSKKAKDEIAGQKDEIEKQHQSLEEQHKEIKDSITYAQRLQTAMLPPVTLFNEILPENFLLYKPKDIVSGDFYWLEQKHGVTLFAAADCTGHGVPGAMVSVICNNALNRCVREYNLNDPGKILDKTREIVIQEFEKSNEEVKDGMDISLCGIMNQTLHWAGANNPLWIVRSGELIEQKADKQPVGKQENSKPFTSHKIYLEKGDMIYVFSDGFADQFGGPKGKKFMSSKFKKLVISFENETMSKQKEILNKTFEDWRSDQEQLDDVCVIGVRV
jgi:serine phosphatase RsbU (regulator of sigma subunit)